MCSFRQLQKPSSDTKLTRFSSGKKKNLSIHNFCVIVLVIVLGEMLSANLTEKILSSAIYQISRS